jgi:RNA polymerase sigma factor (sigma-70 family)
VGDDPAFERWYREEYPRLVNTLAAAVHDREIAQEAAAEACTRALERWERVGRLDRPGGWVYRVGLNDARRRLRRRDLEAVLLRRHPVREAVAFGGGEHDHELWAAVAELGERTRTAVLLRYVADLTEPDIAQAMGVRRGTVATLLRRARATLGRRLSEGVDTEELHVTHT